MKPFMSSWFEEILKRVELKRAAEDSMVDKTILEEMERVELKLSKAFNHKPLRFTANEVDEFCKVLKDKCEKFPELRIGQLISCCLPEWVSLFYTNNSELTNFVKNKKFEGSVS